jgi:hypothetical protein
MIEKHMRKQDLTRLEVVKKRQEAEIAYEEQRRIQIQKDKDRREALTASFNAKFPPVEVSELKKVIAKL